MIKLANITRHNQLDHIEDFKSFGFDIDPEPLAPTKSLSRNTGFLITAIEARIRTIKAVGFDAILVGGLTSNMIYAWHIAQHYKLDVFSASFIITSFKQRKLTSVKRIHSSKEINRVFIPIKEEEKTECLEQTKYYK